MGIESLRGQLQNFMDSWFERSLSVSISNINEFQIIIYGFLEYLCTLLNSKYLFRLLGCYNQFIDKRNFVYHYSIFGTAISI